MKELSRIKNNTLLIKKNVKGCYQQAVKGFFLWLGDREITLEAVREYRQILIDSNSSASKINNFLFGVRGVLKQCLEEMDLPESRKYRIEKEINNIKTVKMQKQPVENYLTFDEYRELQENCTVRMGLIIEFLFTTGCRISEALNIKLDAIHPINGHCEILIMGKGSKQRKIKVATSLIDAVKTEFSGQVYLFETKFGNPLHPVNVTKDIKKLGQRVLDKKISAHTLRHSFATYMIGKTRKIKAVSKYLGHSTTAITLDMYTHETLTPDELGINGMNYNQEKNDNQDKINKMLKSTHRINWEVFKSVMQKARKLQTKNKHIFSAMDKKEHVCLYDDDGILEYEKYNIKELWFFYEGKIAGCFYDKSTNTICIAID